MFVSPTCVGRDPALPLFLPPLYQPYPLPKRKKRPVELGPTRTRDLLEEARELSEEEAEYEEKCNELKMRGFNYMVPLGKTLTQHEEQIDQATDSATEAGDQPEEGSADAENDNALPANTTGEAEAEEQDLDAEIEDLEGQNEFEEEEEEDDGDGNAELSVEEADAMSE